MILQVFWKFWIFFQEKTKRSSKFVIYVKKYEICDFGGWFDNFSDILPLLLFGEMGENRRDYDWKKQKDPRKTRNEFSLVGKQELDFSRIFW